MPNTTPSARYDLPWKAAIAHALQDFMAFFFAELSTEIDWRKRPRFRDKELAGISYGSATDTMVADKLVEVFLRDGSVRWVLIHIEVQAQRNAALAERVHDYNYRITKEYRQPVASLVLLADEDPHWRPCEFHHRVLGTVMGISFTTAKLLDFAPRTDELLASHNPFALVTLAHLRTQQARHDPDQLAAAKWQLTKLLYQHGWHKTRIIVLFKVINWMMALPEQYQQHYWQAVLTLEKEQKMELLPPFFQDMVDEGVEKGRKEGALAILERQLVRRFGPLSETVRAKLVKASLPQLEVWADALPEATSLHELLTPRE
ncbi:DUF4351 domain-containing protein [Duganella sp. FT80W]|uniref:DUF4351 domain-containing protein n=1 Tax=Duganella guangzhouensis TaxID=2666084 RepID=A0A6I2KZH1_9BURK|nr:DUF4351 domain-containing protein [Duganella guangzhouensis]MRW89874.1 DUF4351 domain-containing protein [Duganella guangzhouensis]